MFDEGELVDKEYSDSMAPSCIYESSNIIHDASVNNLVSYARFLDKKQVVCSSDVSGRLCFSVLTDDVRIELQYKVVRAHFNPIKRVFPLGKSPFVATFAENEPIKIWNTAEKYLSLIVNQFKNTSDLDFCICDASNYTVVVDASGMVESHKLEFTNLSKNVFDQGMVLKKKIVHDLHPKFKMVLESANRIELPYFALLVAEEEMCTMKVYIVHLNSFDVLAVKTVGGCSLLSQAGLFEVDLVNFKNVRQLEHIDSWEEYYQNVKVLLYDYITGDFMRFRLEDSGGITRESSMASIGAFSGRPVFNLNVDRGQSPHLLWCADLTLEYICITGNYANSLMGFDEEQNQMEFPKTQAKPSDSKSKKSDSSKTDSRKIGTSQSSSKKQVSSNSEASKASEKKLGSKVASSSKSSLESKKKSSSKSRSKPSKQSK